MASTRIGNDVERLDYNQDNYHDSLSYMLNVPGNGTTPDFIDDPHIRLQKFGANLSVNVVDIDSSLKGVDKQLSREGPVVDTRDTFFNDTYMKKTYPTYSQAVTDEPRAVMPAWQVRSLEQNNWDYLPQNPQNHTEMSFANNIDSRRLDKDSYDMRCRDRTNFQ